MSPLLSKLKSVVTTVALLLSLQVSTAFGDQLPVPAETAAVGSPEGIAHFYVFGLGLGLGVGGAMSWKFHRTWTGKFERIHEGWFGKDTYAGGSDKIGHFYTDYLLVRAYNDIYTSHNFSRRDALLYSFLGSMTTRTVMEVADGFTTFKFSMEDLIANSAGSVVSTALLASGLDSILGFSWTYAPSTEKLDGKVDAASIDNDYNGSIYHMDVKIKGLRQALAPGHGSQLDHYNVGVSYFTRGYDKERPSKHRYVGLTVGANLDEILASNDAAEWSKTRALVRYFKLPYTFCGLYYDLDHHQTGFRYGLNYFY